MSSLWEINNGTLTLNLHPGQTKAWDSTARIVAVIAGSQSGKTSFLPWWLRREISWCGGGDYIAATASYDMFKLKLLPEIRNVFEHILNIGRYWSGDKVMELRNPLTGKFSAKRADDPMWGRIILRSASSPGGLESASAKAAALDEAGQDSFPLLAYEAVIRRLSLSRGRVFIGTTPYNVGWLKQIILDHADGVNIDVINFPSITNPSFPKEEYEERERTMEPWKFKMFYKGIIGRPPGMIYGDFVDDFRENGGHKVHPFEIPLEWPRFVGGDPGANNHALIWGAVDIQGRIIYIYRESLEGGKSTGEHATGARDLAAAHGEHVVMYFIGQKSETQQRIDWTDAGVPNVEEPPFHDVESGIDKIIAVLRQFRIYFFETCKLVLDEIGRYKRKLDPTTGQVLDEIEGKQHFHLLDALRYLIAGVEKATPAPALPLAVAVARKTAAPSTAERDIDGLHAMIAPRRKGRQ